MTHAEIQERLALYALDALEADEARVVAEHLRTCDGCAAELAELHDALGELAMTETPVEPSPALRARVLASVQAAPEKSEARRGDVATRGASATRRPRIAAAGWLGGLAAAAAAAFLLWSDFNLRREREAVTVALEAERARAVEIERELVVAKARAETAEKELASARERAEFALAALARERATAALVSDPRTTNVALGGAGPAGEARGRIAVNRELRQAVLFCSQMPAAPAGKAYQLWFIADGKPAPGGVFRPQADGTCLFADRIPPEGSAATTFAITLEPETGVPAPTGEIFLVNSSS